jgi:hypothetical protein
LFTIFLCRQDVLSKCAKLITQHWSCTHSGEYLSLNSKYAWSSKWPPGTTLHKINENFPHDTPFVDPWNHISTESLGCVDWKYYVKYIWWPYDFWRYLHWKTTLPKIWVDFFTFIFPVFWDFAYFSWSSINMRNF